MLKVDIYTKVVLTVIAVCLIVPVFELITPAEAGRYLQLSTGGETRERIRLEEESQKRLMREQVRLQKEAEKQLGRNITRTQVGTITDFLSLEGAIVVAKDGQFLGKITANSVDRQSILNRVGVYGSEVSSTSIFNTVGSYGSEVARYSPFNPVTSTPPMIYKQNRFIAYLTVNEVKTPRVDPFALIGWLRMNE